MDTQTRIILACCTIHNFVRSIEGPSADTFLATEPRLEVHDIQPAISFPESGATSSKIIDKFRDELAEKIWADYQGYITEQDKEILRILATIEDKE